MDRGHGGATASHHRLRDYDDGIARWLEKSRLTKGPARQKSPGTGRGTPLPWTSACTWAL